VGSIAAKLFQIGEMVFHFFFLVANLTTT
jgi:hypothetical protein